MDDLALSALDWWAEAGVDSLVDEQPRDWLATAPRPDVDPPAAPQPAAAVLPDDLAAFRAWLLADPSVPGPTAARLDATGDPASGTTIVIDMPEAGDRAERRLLGGDAGALFDRMLAAMGLNRDALYLAPLGPARPATGRLDAAQAATLAVLMRHHLGLVRPRRLLLLGDTVATALLGEPCAHARGRVHKLAGDGWSAAAVASFHPRLLVQTPARKAAAWADLQLFMAL